MRLFFGIILSFVLFSSLSFAQKNAPTTANPEGRTTTTIETPSDIFANPNMIGGVKTYNDGGRTAQLNSNVGRQFVSKDEVFLGVRSQSGFGLYGQIRQDYRIFTPGGKFANGYYTGDPSVSLMHPIYSSDRTRITGLARQYFPASVHSTSENIYHTAYYLNILNELRGGYDLFNQFTSRYFSATNYMPNDGVFYEEYMTTFSKLVSQSVRVGFGQQFQLETHNDIPVGKTLELFPYADFMFSKTIFGGPRIYVPVAVQNYVYDAPTDVSLNNVMAEIYFQATL
jgi:hypothetical protein